MGPVNDRVASDDIWRLTRKQHGVVARSQLLELGLSDEAIRHRLSRGRLHRLTLGVYVVGRPQVPMRGLWMAAVLACGPHALLSHRSAAALLGIQRWRSGSAVEVVVPARLTKRRPGIRAYRRAASCADRNAAPVSGLAALHWRLVDDIPVTGPATVLVDLAHSLPTGQLEATVNEADHLDLVDPEALRFAVDALPRRPGARRLRELLDGAANALTSTVLERHFLPLAREAGLPLPTTQAYLGSHRVDFYWEELGLVVETDSLRYHRTAFKQAADKRRDNQHALSGFVTLRFTHGQVRHEPDYVRAELKRLLAIKLDRKLGL
jgi:very-short-patch-repair endonuclease/predicted transcriptional regulator of viral defense system